MISNVQAANEVLTGIEKAAILMLSIGLNSWRRMATKGVTWKGRTYQGASA